MFDVLGNSFCFKLIVFFIASFKNSIVFNLILFFFRCFKESIIYKCFCFVLNKIQYWGKYSFLNAVWTNFVKSKPAYLYSFCYNLFCKCLDKLNVLAGNIYKCLENIIDNSIFCKMMSRSEKLVYVLGAYVLLDYIFRVYIVSLSSIWDELLFIVLVLICFYKWFVGRNKIKTTPLDFPLIAFYIICLFVFIVNNPDTRISIEGMRIVVQFTLWYFIAAWLIQSHKDIKILLLVTVSIGTLLALHGVYQYIANVPMPANWIDSVEHGIRTRVFSIVGSPNILGCLMTLIIPLTVSFVFAEKKVEHKFVFLISALAMTACLIFTSSRGAWIGFACAAIFYVFLKDKRLIIPTCILLLLLVIAVPSVSSRLTYMLTSEYTNSSLRGGRLARWLNGLIIISNHPFFGLGFGQFGGAVAMNNNIKDTFYMDNYYLKTAVEMGLVGLSAFVLLMLNVLKWGYKTIAALSNDYNKELSIGILSGLVGVIVHNFFENIFEVPYMVGYFWILIAALMCFKAPWDSISKEL